MSETHDTPALPPADEAARLEEMVDRFEDAWQAGGRPAIDDHLADGGDDLLIELVHVDLEYRLKAGEAARVETYLGRYPRLAGDRAAVLELLAAEWKLRRRADPSVGADEYLRRFPGYRDELMASATVSLAGADAATPAAGERPAGCAGPPAGEAATRSRYRILRLHARGGLGEILAARDEDLHREVALKRLQPRATQGAEGRGRFLREAEITSQLEHPGVVPVYGLGQTADGSPVYAMRFIRGETFQEAVDRFHRAEGPPRAAAERRLAFRRLLGRFVSVCNTVAYAHSRCILHRDIKPGNILLGSYGETLLVDWGLAKSLSEPGAGPAAETTGAAEAAGDWTQAGEVIGTPAYMSPEQADGRWDAVGPASDVYSLGATLYVLLTGRPPFGPGLVGEVLEKVRRGAFPRPRQADKSICPSLEAICLKATAARPEQRYPSALALAGDLEKWLAGEPVAARREPALTRARRWVGRRPTLATAAAVALAAVAAVAVVTALWFAAADRERSAAAVAEARRKELERADRERYYFHVAAADREWWARRFPECVKHLADCKPELHGWEWNYLERRSLAAGGLLTLRGHDKEVWNVAYSPDGGSIASASLDGTVRVWDAADGRPRFEIGGHEGRVWAVAYSPDGAVLATGGGDRTVRLWDAKTGRPLRSFENLAGEVHGVAFSRDGKLLAAAATGWLAGEGRRQGGEVLLWDWPSGKRRASLSVTGGGPVCVAVSPDGATVAAGTLDGRVRRWDAATGEERAACDGPQAAVRAVAFAPDGGLIAAAANDGSLAAWDAHTGAAKYLVYGHYAPAWGVAFSPDGRRVATSADDATVKVWEAAHGQLMFSLYGHAAGIANVVFSPDGARLASASDDQTVKVWDARNAGPSQTFCGHKHSVWGVALSPDGRMVASAADESADDHSPADDAAVRVWDAVGNELTALHVPRGARGVAFDARGRFLAAAGVDGTVRVWDADAGWAEHVLRGHAGKVFAISFSPDGRLLASASADGTVKLWDAETWTEVRTLHGHAGEVRSVAFGPDGVRLASGGADKTVRVWETATGREERSLADCATAVQCVAFSPDGRRLAAAAAASEKVLTSDSGKITIWDLETSQVALTLGGHLGDVRAVAYSPDGGRLVSAGSDRRLKLWEPTTGQEILTLYGAHLNCVNAVAFGPGGGRLASASCDGTVILWDGTPPG